MHCAVCIVLFLQDMHLYFVNLVDTLRILFTDDHVNFHSCMHLLALDVNATFVTQGLSECYCDGEENC